MRRIGVATLSRSEYGILRPVLKRISVDPDLRLVLYVGGMHLSPDFGLTVAEIEQPIDEQVECLMSSDSPQGIAKSMGLTTMGFAQAFARNRPDILLVTGDRFEMHAATVAAIPFHIPIAHLDGGALTYGADDEHYRHSMTKLAHLHFAYTEENAKRIRQMGEEPWRVHVTGNPALDDLIDFKPWTWQELEQVGVRLIGDDLLIVFHSPTMEYEKTGEYTDNLLAALEQVGKPVVMVMPTADTAGRVIVKKMRHFAARYPLTAQCHTNLWPDVFRSLMYHCVAMVGNSSAGIMEAPSFKLPVVNVGTRQDGRARAKNVIHVGYSIDGIVNGIEWATDLGFRVGLADLTNPYGDGNAAGRIVDVLKSIPINSSLLVKRWAA